MAKNSQKWSKITKNRPKFGHSFGILRRSFHWGKKGPRIPILTTKTRIFTSKLAQNRWTLFAPLKINFSKNRTVLGLFWPKMEINFPYIWDF